MTRSVPPMIAYPPGSSGSSPYSTSFARYSSSESQIWSSSLTL